MKILLLLLISSVCYSQKKDTANYILIGKKPDFELLYKAVVDPDNVTRKQVSDIAHWLIQIRAILADTTKKPKK